MILMIYRDREALWIRGGGGKPKNMKTSCYHFSCYQNTHQCYSKWYHYHSVILQYLTDRVDRLLCYTFPKQRFPQFRHLGHGSADKQHFYILSCLPFDRLCSVM